MTTKEVKKLVRELRKLGVTQYKTPEIELSLGPPPPRVEKIDSTPAEIPHVIQDLVSIMKLSDGELVDRLFPEQVEVQDGV